LERRSRDRRREEVSRLDIRIALLEGMLKRSRLAEHDARVLAHAYEHDSKPPADVVTRSLARAAGREP